VLRLRGSGKLKQGWIEGARKIAKVAVAAFLLLTLPRADAVPPRLVFDYRVGAMVAGYQFNLATWEVGAVVRKLGQMASNPARGLSEAEKKAAVLEYLSLMRRIAELEEVLTRLYSGERDEDSAKAARSVRLELEELRRRQAERQGLVEAILEEQIGRVLASEGLVTLGHVWPPVKFRFERLPLYLVISPRDRIMVRKGVYLQHGLDIEQQEALEERIDRALNVSSLVVGVGGLSAYPAMIVESASLEFVLKAAAHEWVHHYLFFKPLGWHYEDSQQLRTMNETVASIVGDEVGALVMARYYPELVPPAVEEGPERPEESEFNREMRRIRLTVDRMLAAGDIEGAEAYMEARRRYLVSQGYYIRKLNQAYFAFYGSYATSPISVDPIGGKLKELRRRCGSLKEFLHTVAAMTSYEDLERALGEKGGARLPAQGGICLFRRDGVKY